MLRRFPVAKRLFFSIIVIGTGSVWAQSPPANPAKVDRDNLPESVRRVERETGGEVLRAEPMQRDGREVYRLKVLTADGRVRVVQDDPSDRRSSDRQESRKGKQKQSSRDPDGEPPQH